MRATGYTLKGYSLASDLVDTCNVRYDSLPTTHINILTCYLSVHFATVLLHT